MCSTHQVRNTHRPRSARRTPETHRSDATRRGPVRVPKRVRLGALALVLSLVSLPASPGLHAQTADDEVVAVVDAFHQALVAGDSTAALALLSDDVVILEGGGVETKDEYRSGHLAGDMRYAGAVPAERGEMEVRRSGDVAWAWSTSVRQGRMGKREIDSRGAELVVLRRGDDGLWRITAIHWSSRSR